jgi:uncharacterized protein (DUF362 family)
MHRREFIAGVTAMGLGSVTASCHQTGRWTARAYRKLRQSQVAILRAASYQQDLTPLIVEGIRAFSLPVRGKRVLLKPNLVEYDSNNVVNTHPAVIGAAIQAFRELGAAVVKVGEGPGHRRDTDGLLLDSGLLPCLKESGAEFVDLNLDDTRRINLLSHYTGMDALFLPESVLTCDLLVSMPKIKTHHWAGMTLSLKNMFGIVPGVHYGWPKNLLHWRGIDESVVDINSTVYPHFVIADGIVAMEGNGPIQGKSKACGVLVLGDDPVAVDSTCARVAGLNPAKIKHLQLASQFLGNSEESRILQIGEPLSQVISPFEIIDAFQYLRS